MAEKKGPKSMIAVPTDAALAAVSNAFPVEEGTNNVYLPRLGMVSQDKFEGKGKNAVLVKEAGMFFTEQSTDETDDEGKKVWEQKELGSEIEGIIVYKRKQLRHYDEATETFTSSPIYDSNDEIIPLFANKAEIERGTPADLKKRYEYTTPEGKVKSKLEDNLVLYVLYEDELYQLNLRGSSMYSFRDYEKKARPSVPAVLTGFSSTAESKGSIEWNKMQFTPIRQLTADEVANVAEIQQEMIAEVQRRKAQFADQNRVDAEFAAHGKQGALEAGK